MEAQVQSLVRELRAHKPRDMAKKKKRQGPPQKNPTKQGHLIQLHSMHVRRLTSSARVLEDHVNDLI